MVTMILTIEEFSINGDIQTIIELIVENANRINSGWDCWKC